MQVMALLGGRPQPGKVPAGVPSGHAILLFFLAAFFSTGWLLSAAQLMESVIGHKSAAEGDDIGASSHATPLHAMASAMTVAGYGFGSGLLILTSGALAYHRSSIGECTGWQVGSNLCLCFCTANADYVWPAQASAGILVGSVIGACWHLVVLREKSKVLNKFLIQRDFFTKTEFVRSPCKAAGARSC